MPELPRVSQEFDADVAPYIRALEEAALWAERFAEANSKAIDSVERLNAALRALPELKDITVRVTYETIGRPEDIAAVQQVVQVVVPAAEAIKPIVQPVTQIVTGTREPGSVTQPVTEQVTGIREPRSVTQPVTEQATRRLPPMGDINAIRQATAALREETSALRDEGSAADAVSSIISALNSQLDSGDVSLRQYIVAMDNLRAATGGTVNMEREASVLVGRLNQDFGSGEISARQFASSLNDLRRIMGETFTAGRAGENFTVTETGAGGAVAAADEVASAWRRVGGAGRDMSASMNQIISAVNATSGAEERLFAVSSNGIAELRKLAREQTDAAMTANELRDAIRSTYNVSAEYVNGLKLAAETNARMAASSKLLDATDKELASEFHELRDSIRAASDSYAEYENHVTSAMQAVQAARNANVQAGEANVFVAQQSMAMDAAIAKVTGDTETYKSVMAQAAVVGKQLGGAATSGGAAAAGAAAGWTLFGMSLLSVVHWAFMLSAEILAVLIPSIYALAAGAAVMLQGAVNVGHFLNSTFTAAEALNPMLGQTAGDFLGLGHSLQTAQDMANPGVYELLGEAIKGVNAYTGQLKGGLSEFGIVGLGVTHMLDQFGAKVVSDLQGPMGAQLHALVAGAVNDLRAFGQILGNLGHALLNLAGAMPGLAVILLHLVNGFTELIKWVSSLPAPLLTAIMVIEEMYRWGGALAAGMGLLGRAIAALGTLGLPIFVRIGAQVAEMFAAIVTGVAGAVLNLGKLSQALVGAGEVSTKGLATKLEGIATFLGGPWGVAIGLGVIAVGALVFWMMHAKDATQKWIDTSQQLVSNASNLQVLNVIGQQMATNAQKIADAQDKITTSNNQLAQAQSTSADAAKHVGSSYSNMAQNMNSAALAEQKYSDQRRITNIVTDQAQTSVAQLTGNQKQLVSEGLNVVAGAADISKRYGVDFVSALGMADMAGVNLSKTGTTLNKVNSQASIQIDSMWQAYARMNQTGTILSNTMGVINIQAGIQASKVSQTNQAWDQFVQMGTSLTGTFTQLNLDIEQMGNQAPTAGGKIRAFSGQTQLSVGQIAQALTSFSGQSAQTWQAYNQSVDQANKFTDALRVASVAGVVSHKDYTQAVASVVGQLIPYAAHSKAATAELSIIAQEAGGPATSNFQTLKSWVDKNAVSSDKFNGMLTNMTVGLSNVSAVAKQFAGTLQADVVNAVAAAAVDTTSITTAVQNYTKALQAYSANSPQAISAQKALNGVLQQYQFPADGANQITSQIANMYGKTLPPAAAAAQKAVVSFADNGLHYSTQKAQDLFNNFVSGGADWALLINDTGDAKQKFIDFAVNGLKMTRGEAQKTWDNFNGPAKDAWNALAAGTSGAKSDFGNFAKNGLNLTQSQAQSLWKNLINNGDAAWLAAHAGALSTKDAFITLAKNGLNLTQQQAQFLWDNMNNRGRTAFANMMGDLGRTGVSADNLKNNHLAPLKDFIRTFPNQLNVRVNEQGVGNFTITQGTSGHAGGTPTGGRPGAAAGMRVPGFGGGDIFPALLEPGEAVVPKHLVGAVAPFLAAHRVPGFTSGGLIPRFSGNIEGLAPWTRTDLQAGENMMTAAMKSAMTAAMKSASAAAMAAMIGTGVGGMGDSGQHSGSASVAQAFARSIMAQYHWGPEQWPPWLFLGNQESGWNSFAVNPSSGAYGIGQCYTTDMMILTRRGWLKHDEVQIGDETVGYNPETGYSEWTKVTAVLHPGVHRVVRYGNSRVEFTTTPNHRWLMSDKRTHVESMREIQNRRSRSILVLAKEAETGDGLPITDDEAALLGWIAGDGWERKAYPKYGIGRRGGSPATFHISQTKQENWPRIEAALAGHGSITRTRERTLRGEPRLDREWRLSAPYARGLTERAGHPKTDCVQQVLLMSASQRKAWLNAMFLAEGSLGKTTRCYSQNPGSVAEAIKIAIYLDGSRPSAYERPADHFRATANLKIYGVKPTLHVGHPGFFYEDAGEEEVWCVTTELGTFTAEQNGHIHLTGNSLGHGHPYNLGDYVNQVIWMANYIRSTYGNPANAWAHERRFNWYDNGGLLMPGLTMAYNGTGRPERVIPGGSGEDYVIHNVVNLDGGKIFENMQKRVFAYNLRNRGTITGGLSNLNR